MENLMNYIEEFYNARDEDARLTSKHGSVEYLTTMKYIRESIAGADDPAILEVVHRTEQHREIKRPVG